MKYRNIASTAVQLPVIGQGCMGIGGYFASNTENDQQQVETLEFGIQNGLTLIDTAEVYGAGHSEELVGRATQGKRSSAFIATKVSPEHLSYHDVLASAEGSLRRLKTDYIDLYQVHWPNPAIPLEETLRAMKTLVDQGKIRFAGVSNFYCNALRKACQAFLPQQIASNQMEYNLFDRSIETDVLPYCRKESILLIAYSPLDQGQSPRDIKRALTLRQLGEKHKCTPAQICLAWLVAHDQVIAIPKAGNINHINENAAAAAIVLSRNDFEEISKVFTPRPVYITPNKIQVVQAGLVDRKVYTTILEALDNKAGFVPSPADLATALKEEENVKPVRVVKLTGESNCEYGLVEGRIRYWAWVIAYGEERPIPAYIR